MATELDQRFKKELRSQEKNLYMSRHLLVLSSVTLWVGAAALAISLGMALGRANDGPQASAVHSAQPSVNR